MYINKRCNLWAELGRIKVEAGKENWVCILAMNLGKKGQAKSGQNHK